MHFDGQRPPLPTQPHFALVRALSLLMAICSTTWATSIALGVLQTGFPRIPDHEVGKSMSMTLAVYLLTIGYWWRVFRYSIYQRRIAVWCFSFMLNVGFLAAAFWLIANDKMWIWRDSAISIAWWFVAVIMSVVIGKLEPVEVSDATSSVTAVDDGRIN